MTDSSLPQPRTPFHGVAENADTPADTEPGPPRSRSDAKAVHPSSRPRPSQRSRVSTSLPRDLRDRLAKVCVGERTTESAVVCAALSQYLDSSTDKELLMRRFDRLDQAVGQVRRAHDLLTEAFAGFLKIWFAHTPSVMPDGRRAALTTSEGRYLQFVEYVAARMASGQRFAQDLARDSQAGGDEPDCDTPTSKPSGPPKVGPQGAGSAGHESG